MIFTCRLHSASAAGRKRPAPIWTLTACGTKPCAQPTRASRCSTVPIPAARELAAQPLVILEGSYSHHPLLTGCETLRVFLTCAKEEQTRRLQAREGERYANFAARWVPLEEGYFAQYGIAECADFVVDTTAGRTI